MFRASLLALVALVLVAAPAQAEDELPTTSRFFEEFDQNSDGVVTSDEFDGSPEVFRLLDKDEDGRITATELGLPANYRPDPKRNRGATGGGDAKKRRGGDDAARGNRLIKAIEKMDKNGDGKVGKDEFRGNDNLFERLDRNGDGVLDKSDTGDGMGMDGPMAEQGGAPTTSGSGGVKGQKPNKTPRNAGGGGGERGPVSAEQAEERFRKLDTDEDGELTDADDIPDRFARMVTRMDADESGGVSLAEFQDAVKKAQSDRGNRQRRNRGGGKQIIKRFDQDRDGRVSRDEFPGADQRFDAMDKDGDGFLTMDDFEQPAKDTPKGDVTGKKSLLETLDKDGDGKLNRAEFDGSDEDWARLDQNKDGWVTKDELGEG